MKKSSLPLAMRAIALLVGIAGTMLLLRSTVMGISQAQQTIGEMQGMNMGRFATMQGGFIAAYRTLGAVLAGVGFFHALRPFSPAELQQLDRQGAETEESPSSGTSLMQAVDEQEEEEDGPRIHTAFRILNVSPGTVYWAFIDPTLLVRWLPPKGMKARVEEFQPQAGGAYRIVMTHLGVSAMSAGKSSADSDVVSGRFVELVPGKRIVQAVSFDSPDPAYAGEMVLTWELQAIAERTRVTVVCEQVPIGIRKIEHERALAETLANLEKVVG